MAGLRRRISGAVTTHLTFAVYIVRYAWPEYSGLSSAHHGTRTLVCSMLGIQNFCTERWRDDDSIMIHDDAVLNMKALLEVPEVMEFVGYI